MNDSDSNSYMLLKIRIAPDNGSYSNNDTELVSCVNYLRLNGGYLSVVSKNA